MFSYPPISGAVILFRNKCSLATGFRKALAARANSEHERSSEIMETHWMEVTL